jgi:hypothetical protein
MNRFRFSATFAGLGLVFLAAVWWGAGIVLATQVLDWAWIGNQPSGGADPTTGFLNLSCDNNASCTAPNGNTPNVEVDLGTGEVSGWAWFGESGDAANGYDGSVGWIDFDADPLPAGSPYAYSPTCLYPAPDVVTGTCSDVKIDSGGEVYGWARVYHLAQEGDRQLGTAGGDNDWGWVLLRGLIDDGSGRYFGVTYDATTQEFDGWGWSGGGTLASGAFTKDVGLGWIDFTLAISAAFNPFITTEGGDIYAGGDISGSTDTTTLTPAYDNATFLVDAGGTVSLFTTTAGPGGISTGVSPIETPTSGNNFTTALGKLDIDKLVTQVNGTKNVYGQEVEFVAAPLVGDVVLGNRVLVFDNDGVFGNSSMTGASAATWISPVNFVNGSGALVSGAGTMVVDGDLNFLANTHYGGVTPTDTTNLASAAWIVLGDVQVDPSVTNLVGAFMVLGGGTSTGMFETQSSGGLGQRLNIEGLILARSFGFHRLYEGTYGYAEPAESVRYGSRFILNPPPGLIDFETVLPTITPVAP